ncbi:hypothetical protein K490DRAFT_66990 [Saccharata proteae CBS 121410]|uniref:Uncharacterized protein n=1 Tax=Saccharata proteae CBS 121410 TaxID=1314787 RepID=A0A9P4HQK0_9PEZI|nr:hypothetical protein K490DRAFT_66990 [Saccharata proteae CBS 121410]
MIATTSYWQHQNTPNYMPPRPSPLAPRSANAPLHPPYMDPSNAKNDVPFAKRGYKPNPILKSRHSVTERRRDLFLKKVQEKRDDRRWEGREDQILRLDWFSRQKRWEANLARTAPKMDEPPEEEEEEAIFTDRPVFSSQQDHHMTSSQPDWSQKSTVEEEVEVVAQQEDQELDALLAMMEEEENKMAAEYDEPQTYGSDDEDYDRIFSDLLNEDQSVRSHEQHPFVDDDAMDMSNG